MKMTGKQRLVAIVLTICMALSMLIGATVLVSAEDIPTSGSISDLTAVYTYVENEDELGTLQIDALAELNIGPDEYVMFYIYENVEDISDPTNGNTNLQTTTKGFYASSLVEGTALSKELQITPLKLNGKCVLGVQIANRGDNNDWVYAYITTALVIDANGGENTADNTMQIRLGFSINSELEGKELVEKDRCVFIGWGDVPEGPAISNDVLMSQYGDTVYALWELVVFDVNFHPGEGVTGTMPTQVFDKNVPETLDRCTFEKFGYEFSGWATEEGGDVVYQDGEEITVDSDLDLYPVWDKLFSTVSFNANGGSGTMDNQIINYSDTVALSANEFTYYGYEFIGWSLTSDGEVAYADKANFTSDANDVELFAVWNRLYTSVLFNPNGGEGYKAPQTDAVGETNNLDANVFYRTGYEFIGWSLTPGGEVAYDDTASYLFEQPNQVLYAVWKNSFRAILFNPNGGVGYKKPQANIPSESTVNLDANVFSRDGYEFIGWATTPTGSVAYADKASYTVGVKNDVLYAVWQENGLKKSALPKAGWHMTPESDKVDVTDALAALRGAVEIGGIDDVMLFAYDFDGDGWITVADALTILRISVAL